MQRSVKRCTIPTIGPRWPTLHDSGGVGCNRRIFPRFPVEKGPNLVHHRARRTPHRGRKTRLKGDWDISRSSARDMDNVGESWLLCGRFNSDTQVSLWDHRSHEVLAPTVSTTSGNFPGPFQEVEPALRGAVGDQSDCSPDQVGATISHRRGALPVDSDRPGCSPGRFSRFERCRVKMSFG